MLEFSGKSGDLCEKEGINTLRKSKTGSPALQLHMKHKLKEEELSEMPLKDLPGGSVAKTPCYQCRRPKVQSLVRELYPTCHNSEFACHS